MAHQFLFILCLTMLIKLATPLNDASVFGKYVKVQGTDAERFMKIVTISDYLEPSGVLFTPDESTNNDVEDHAVHPSHDFYAAVSCEFARWTMNKIFDFLKQTPLYYQNGFDNHRVYKKTFGRKFTDLLKSLAEIDPYVERFVNVLHSFAKNHPMYTYYSDPTLVKSLISLRLKIHFALSRGTTDGDGFENAKLSDGRVVRLIAEELNVLQRYLSTNCAAETPNDVGGHFNFAGYWITKIDHATTTPDTIDSLLFSIRPLKLESDGPNECLVRQMLLENFASPNSDDPVSRDIIGAVYNNSPDLQIIPVMNIIRRLTEVYDVDLMFFYQNCIITGIVKSLFNRTLKVFKTNTEFTKIKQLVSDISLKISTSTEHFPELLVDCIRFLNEICMSNGYLNEKHEGFRESLMVIKLDNSKKPLTKKETVDDLISNKIAVENFLTKVIENIDDFKCFHRSTVIRRIDHEIYYKTFTEIIETYFIQAPVKDQMFKLCVFTELIYSICYQAVIYVNRCIEKKEPLEKINLFERVMKEFNRVRRYILTVIIIKINDIIFRRMAFKVAIIMFENRFNYDRIYYVKQIFNVVMTELNIFGTKYCESSKFNNLLINNIDLIGLGNVVSIDEYMVKYFKKIDLRYNTTWITTNISSVGFEHININSFLYTQFVLNSPVFNMYEENIIFFWKGRMLTVKQIFKNSTVFILNYYDLYALYDIYFKFYIAVVFYETTEILSTEKWKRIELKFGEMKKRLNDFDDDYFPTNLHNLIADIKALWSVPLTPNDSKKGIDNNFKLNDLLANSIESIERQFTKFGIEFRRPNTCCKIIRDIKVFLSSSKEKFETINYDLDVRVFWVFNRYKTLKMLQFA